MAFLVLFLTVAGFMYGASAATGDTLTASDEDDEAGMTVSVTYDAGVLQSGTEMEVTRLSEDEEDRIRELLTRELQKEGRDAAVLRVCAYDIAFSRNGEKTEPDGKVSVRMKPADGMMPEEADTRWKLYHLANFDDDEDPEENNPEAYGLSEITRRSGRLKLITGEAEDETSRKPLREVAFEADSFSTYVLAEVSTDADGEASGADLKASGADLSGGRTLIDDLMRAGIKKLLPVRRAMAADGTSYKLDSEIKSATLEHRGQWETQETDWKAVSSGGSVLKTDQLRFNLAYTLPANSLTGGDGNLKTGTLTYQLPDTFKEVGPITDKPVYSGTSKVGTYSVSEDGLVTITLDENFAKKNAKQEINGTFWFTSSASNLKTDKDGKTQISFSDTTKINLIVKDEDSKSLTVQKTASELYDDGTIRYTVTVNSENGTDKDITIQDVMSGVAYQGGFKVTKTDTMTWSQTDITDSISDVPASGTESFTVTLPKADSKTLYTVTYTGKLRDWEISDGKVSKAGNHVTASSEDNSGHALTADASVTTDIPLISKTGEKSDDGKITWTITVHSYGKDLAGYHVSDTFYGQEIKNATMDGNKVTLPYTFSPGSTKDTYTFVVETDLYEAPGESSSRNTGTLTPPDGGKPVTGTGTADIGGEFQPVTKKAESLTNNGDGTATIRWKVTISADKAEIPATWTYTDVLWNNQTLKNINELEQAVQKAYQEVLGTGQYTVTRNDWQFVITSNRTLPKGKAISFEYETTGTISDSATSTFINNGYVNNGRWASDTIEYSPVVKKFDQRGDSNASTTSHDYFDLTEDGQPGVLKWEIHYINQESATGPIIITEKLPDGVTLLKENGLELRLDDKNKDGNQSSGAVFYTFSWDSDKWNGTWESDVTTRGTSETAHVKSTAFYDLDQNTVTITLDSSFLNAINGSTQLNFVVKAKIDDDFDWSKESIKDENGVPVQSFRNTVTVTDGQNHEIGTDSETQDIKYDEYHDVISKTRAAKLDNNVVPYSIDINKEGKDLIKNSDTVTLKDTLTYYCNPNAQLQARVSLLEDTFKVYRYDEKAADHRGEEITNVTFRYGENEDRYGNYTDVITAVLPDACPLHIEYQYAVIGQLGTTASGVSNTATLEGVSTDASGTTGREDESVRKSGATVTADGIVIYKHDADAANQGLAGVQFAVWKWNGSSYEQLKDLTYSTKPLILTTDKAGKIDFNKGTVGEKNYCYNTTYCLVETKTADGYVLDKTPKYFYIYDNTVSSFCRDPSAADTEKRIFNGQAGYFNIANKKNQAHLTVNKKWLTAKGDDVSSQIQGRIGILLYRSEESADLREITIGTSIKSYIQTFSSNAGLIKKDGEYQSVVLKYPAGTQYHLILRCHHTSGGSLDSNYLGMTVQVGENTYKPKAYGKDGRALIIKTEYNSTAYEQDKETKAVAYSVAVDLGTYTAGDSAPELKIISGYGDNNIGSWDDITWELEVEKETQDNSKLIGMTEILSADGWTWTSDSVLRETDTNWTWADNISDYDKTFPIVSQDGSVRYRYTVKETENRKAGGFHTESTSVSDAVTSGNITIENHGEKTEDTELPATGGSGIGRFIVSGALIAAAAFGILLKRSFAGHR